MHCSDLSMLVSKWRVERLAGGKHEPLMICWEEHEKGSHACMRAKTG